MGGAPRAGRRLSSDALAASGLALFLVAYFLPWVTGPLGQTESLSGWGLAGVALDTADVGIEGNRALAMGGAVVLYLAPALAAGGLVLLLARGVLGLGRGESHALAAVTTFAPVAAASGTLYVVVFEVWPDRLDGLAPGLGLALLGAAGALAASVWALLAAPSPAP